MKKLWQLKFSLLVVTALLANTACGHGGGQDSNGGYVDRSTGEYHCHTDDCVHPGLPAEDVLDSPDGVDDDPITVAGSWGTTKKRARDIIYEDLDTTIE